MLLINLGSLAVQYIAELVSGPAQECKQGGRIVKGQAREFIFLQKFWDLCDAFFFSSVEIQRINTARITLFTVVTVFT